MCIFQNEQVILRNAMVSKANGHRIYQISVHCIIVWGAMLVLLGCYEKYMYMQKLTNIGELRGDDLLSVDLILCRFQLVLIS